jgi:hypothetical protein
MTPGEWAAVAQRSRKECLMSRISTLAVATATGAVGELVFLTAAK